jgi:cysteine-rich repeat protein
LKEALPIGFNTHGSPGSTLDEALDIRGRISGVNGQDVKVRVPLFIVGTTGFVGLEFRDNDTSGTIDTNGLGPVQAETGARGLGDPNSILTFLDGTTFPAFGYDPTRDCCDLPNDPNGNISWGPSDEGTATGNLALAVSWGSGDDQIPGCIGDNDPAQEPLCAFKLGTGSPGNTGADDGALQAVIGGVPGDTRKVFNPDEPAPTIYYVAAGSARDLDVAGSKRNADALFKVEALLCPILKVPDPADPNAFDPEDPNTFIYDTVCCNDPNGTGSDCVFAGGAECGNGVVEEGEECDDGNTEDGDGCSSTCVNQLCGDVNGDGAVNFIDARLILLGQVPPQGAQTADVNGDAANNFIDARLILLGQAPADQCPAVNP